MEDHDVARNFVRRVYAGGLILLQLGVLMQRSRMLMVFCPNPAMQTWLRKAVEDESEFNCFVTDRMVREWSISRIYRAVVTVGLQYLSSPLEQHMSLVKRLLNKTIDHRSCILS